MALVGLLLLMCPVIKGHWPEYNLFLSPDRLPGRNDVTLDKLNFRADIRQNLFFEKNQDIKSLCGS